MKVRVDQLSTLLGPMDITHQESIAPNSNKPRILWVGVPFPLRWNNKSLPCPEVGGSAGKDSRYGINVGISEMTLESI